MKTAYWVKVFVATIIMILVAGSFSWSSVAAQDLPGPTTTPAPTTNGDILSEVQVGTQSAWNGKVPVKVRFGSKVAGQKIEVIWRYPSALKGSQPQSKFYRYEVGQPQVIENQIQALTPGSHVLVVDVVVWGNDSNYISTTQTTIQFDEQLLVVPRTAAYQNAVLIRYAVLGVAGIIALIALLFIGKFAMGLIPKWLEREVNKV